jgi:formate dehydrogenase subunit delta
MNREKLITMANQIAEFFGAMPDHDQAVTETANHLRRSWDPRMRRALFAHIDAHGMAGLSDVMQDVVKAKRADLEPKQ